MQLSKFLKLNEHSKAVDFEVLEETTLSKFRRQLIRYRSQDSDWIPAYLFIPLSAGPHPGVLIHHQHNGERHLGKSEVAGIAGNPLQAFGPSLADLGYVVLAPDSICFEDRRPNKKGIEADTWDNDWLQHFNEMTFRLVKGDSLMRKVLDDAGVGLSLLENLESVSSNQIGVLGHSYGGNTALFQAATDDRIRFVCSSGALCSYKQKMEVGTGLEMALAIPGLLPYFDFDQILGAIAPRDVLIVSAEQDKYSKDADTICSSVEKLFVRPDGSSSLNHFRDSGDHPLTEERHSVITDWFKMVARK
ncbi:MAG: dienelactone hydrolase family protein [Bdellovibrionaceae bacterium]|nr:dienelactone hydrolase family protein [Pseudobdellovibrionaceae bacterium]